MPTKRFGTLGFLDRFRGKKPAKKKQPEFARAYRIVCKIKDETIPLLASFLEEDTQATNIMIRKVQDKWVVACNMNSPKEFQALKDVILKYGGDFFEVGWRPA